MSGSMFRTRSAATDTLQNGGPGTRNKPLASSGSRIPARHARSNAVMSPTRPARTVPFSLLWPRVNMSCPSWLRTSSQSAAGTTSAR